MNRNHPSTTLSIEFGGETLVLLAERGVYWPREELLLVADTHFGKAGIFARAGIPVPQATTDSTLAQIDRMLTATQARRLCVLGDFWHGRIDEDDVMLASLRAWRAAHTRLALWLVRGNHDRHMRELPAWLQLEQVATKIEQGPLCLQHHPPETYKCPTLAGHRHPMARLHEVGRGSLRAPCFHQHDQTLILPAVGAFTGGKAVHPTGDDRLFVCADDLVLELPRRSATTPRARAASAHIQPRRK